MKRILALDVGLRRIGLALSDPLGITAQGMETLQRRNLRTDLAILQRLAAEHEVSLFVVGDPLHMSGDASRQGALVREFAGQLEERCGLPVQLWDERLTTVEANRVLRSSGISQEKRAKAVDRLSAVLILQSYLDALPGANEWPGEE
ncbi:MAG TPA: Holliday junction resolvase RuvX [Bryobacteraceae bacterium]|nr:Holliday junction resolvase RuvX [Bryobacteraceae bacterium]